jgi:hypothetical protein
VADHDGSVIEVPCGIRALFDSVDHNLVLRAVSRHSDQRWILLYRGAWLTALLQREDGTVVERDRGTPQGSAISAEGSEYPIGSRSRCRGTFKVIRRMVGPTGAGSARDP